jgi:hypothetical protein
MEGTSSADVQGSIVMLFNILHYVARTTPLREKPLVLKLSCKKIPFHVSNMRIILLELDGARSTLISQQVRLENHHCYHCLRA